MKNGKFPRILNIGDYIGFAGGIERYIWQSSQLLRELGWEVDYAGGFYSRDAELFSAAFNRVTALSGVLERADDYDMVFLHKPGDLKQLLRLREKFGRKLVFIAHDHDSYCPRRHYYTPLRVNCSRRYTFCRCGICGAAVNPRSWHIERMLHFSARLELLKTLRTVTLSRFMRDNLLRNGFSGERISIIPPFIRPKGGERRDFVPGGVLRLLFIGQLIRGKGADIFLDIASKLAIPFRGCIVGDGKDRVKLERMARREGLADKIEFPGWVSPPDRFWHSADAVLFPFRWQEPFGLGGLEALANGVPQIGFDRGGCKEWLTDGVTGVLLPAGGVDLAVKVLREWSSKPERLLEYSRNSIDIAAERFSPRSYVERMGKLLEDAGCGF